MRYPAASNGFFDLVSRPLRNGTSKSSKRNCSRGSSNFIYEIYLEKRFLHMDMLLKRISTKIPEFCMSHWLFRVPLAIIFIQQGLSKFPVTAEDAEAYELPYLVWWFVSYGELGAGIGLLIGGMFAAKLASIQKLIPELGDMVTRFSGITICSITTGVIWIGQPESLIDVILYDNLHVFLWVGGLFFALRGNRT